MFNLLKAAEEQVVLQFEFDLIEHEHLKEVFDVAGKARVLCFYCCGKDANVFEVIRQGVADPLLQEIFEAQQENEEARNKIIRPDFQRKKERRI